MKALRTSLAGKTRLRLRAFATIGWVATAMMLAGASLAAAPMETNPAAEKEHGTLVLEVPMYVAPDNNAQKVAIATRGRDTFLMGRSVIDGKPWAHVLVVVDTDRMEPREVSGWVDGRAVVAQSTPNGDEIIFGEAVDSERQAENGRRNANQDAMRLYYRMQEYFPTSPLAPEAFWRAADLRWQLEKSGLLTRPSSRERSPDLRAEIEDEMMKEVIKKNQHTKWADLAAYDLMDNKLCGEWKGDTRCPEKESEMYEHYAHEHPQSPKAAEALYNAAWRQAALVEMYKAEHQQDKSEKARKKGIEIAQELSLKYMEGDWRPRAVSLIYALQQNIPADLGSSRSFGR
jgi:hypothetical protein